MLEVGKGIVRIIQSRVLARRWFSAFYPQYRPTTVSIL
jgi:hypothetical protein